jgi:hypothetical protein
MNSGPTAIAAAFDLLCTVTFAKIDDKREKKFDGVEYSYRINLESERFCMESCTNTRAIEKVTDTAIFLWLDRNERDGLYDILYINRETGFFRWSAQYIDGNQTFSGTCKKRTFSGFPERKF